MSKTEKAIARKAEPAAITIGSKIDALRDAGKLADLNAPEDVTDRMVADIFAADDLDAILGGTTPIATLVDQPIVITEANFRPSNVRDNDYAVFRWTAIDGREGVSTNGGLRLVAQLVKMVELGLVPGVVVKVGSSAVEYEEGKWGETFYFVKP